MADAFYDEGRNGLLGGGTHAQPDFVNNDIRLALRDEGTTAIDLSTQVDAADVSAAWVGSHTALASLTVGSVGVGVFDFADETYPSLSGATFESLDLFDYETAVESTSPLIANLDSWTGLPGTPNGGDYVFAPAAGGVLSIPAN